MEETHVIYSQTSFLLARGLLSEPAQTGQQWFEGKDQNVALVSQDPAAPGTYKSTTKMTPVPTVMQPTQESRQTQAAPASQLPTTGPASYGVKKSPDEKDSAPTPSQSVEKPTTRMSQLLTTHIIFGAHES
jgi:hypothetical protein